MNKTEFDKVRTLPLHSSWGVKEMSAENGKSNITAIVGPDMLNPAGMMHGGLLYALADVCAYIALLSVLDEGQSGVTHQINFQVMRPVSLGDEISLVSELIKRGRTLTFLETRGYVNNKLVISATITKSMVLLVR